MGGYALQEISPLVAGLLLSGGDSGDTPDGQRLIKAMTHLNQARALHRVVDQCLCTHRVPRRKLVCDSTRSAAVAKALVGASTVSQARLRTMLSH